MNNHLFSIQVPCENCPFRSDDQAIQLEPGRLDSMIESLLNDDTHSFWCHKALYCQEKLQKKACAGAAAYLMKIGQPSVAMRLFMSTGSIPLDYWDKAKTMTIEPEVEETCE